MTRALLAIRMSAKENDVDIVGGAAAHDTNNDPSVKGIAECLDKEIPDKSWGKKSDRSGIESLGGTIS